VIALYILLRWQFLIQFLHLPGIWKILLEYSSADRTYRLHNIEFPGLLNFLDLINIIKGGLEEIMSLLIHLEVCLWKKGSKSHKWAVILKVSAMTSIRF
jgi:hypothetical protein